MHKSISSVDPLKRNSQKSLNRFSPEENDIISASMEYFKRINTKPEDKEKMIKDVEELVDNFFSQLNVKSFKSQIEPFLSENINCNNVVYWEEITSLRRLYSDKYKVSVNHEDTMIGSSFYETNIQELPVCGKHPKWCPELDGKILKDKGPVIIFNFREFDGSISGLVEVQKKFADPEMSEKDLLLIQRLQSRYTLFSRYFRDPTYVHDMLELSKLMTVEQFMSVFHMKMTQIFHCVESEIWDFSDKTNVILYKNGKIKSLFETNTGIAGYVLSKGQLYSSYSCKRESSYSPVVDGPDDFPFLGIPIDTTVIMIRGCTTKPIFTQGEETILNNISPFIVSFFRNALMFSKKPGSQPGLDLLNGVSCFLPTFNKNKDLKELLCDAMIEIQKATQSDRISFFKLEDNRLESVYMTGCRDVIRLKVGEGIAGHVAATGVEENVSNAQDSVYFQGRVDINTGYQTKSMLTIPIISTEGKVRGVIQLMNKLDGMPFSKRDSLIATVYGSLCTFMTQNTFLLNQNIDLMRRLKKISEQNPLTDDADNSLNELCRTARILLECSGVTVFLINDAKGVVEKGGHDGIFESNFHGHGVVRHCLDRNEHYIINDTFHDALIDKTSDQEKENLVIVPITAANTLLGCIEACNKNSDFTEIDLYTLTAIANIVATSVTQRSMMNVIERGRFQLMISRFITREEVGKSIIPASFSNTVEIDTLFFRPYELSKDGLTSCVFEIFAKLGIYEPISCDEMFAFISRISGAYTANAYHSWVKAVSVTQMMFLILDSLKSVLSESEKMVLTVASLFAYIGHDGTDDAFHRRMGTVESVAAGNTPVHCHVSVMKALHILNKAKGHIFVGENNAEQTVKNIIDLMISSSMMQQNAEKLSELVKTKEFDPANTSHRLLFFKCLYCMCLEDEFCRNDQIVEKWEYLYSIERFALGEKETTNNLTYSSQFNCKELYNKSQCIFSRMKENQVLFLSTTEAMSKESPILAGIHSMYQKIFKHYSQ